MKSLEVVLPTPIDKAFRYAPPRGVKTESVSVGSRVLVPFGPRKLTGVVTGYGSDEGTLREVESVLDDRPALTAEMLDLTRWMADYYHTSWGLAVKAALPTGTDVTGDRAARVSIKSMPFVRLIGRADDERIRGEKQRAILSVLAREKALGRAEVPKRELLDAASASSASLNSLLGQDLLEILDREVIRTPFGLINATPGLPPDHTLHADQEKALLAIHKATERGAFETFLLYGITGSGKTEVYIEALKHVLERGQSAIVLVPEISLTPQTVSRFRSHLGDRVAVQHSRMSLGERYDGWRKLREGKHSVVIGPRSAVLAPVQNLGLIVVDEEQEASYKQYDPAPRYHARDVAVMRAHMNNAVCILGSATPSLESYHNALRGKYTLLTMPERVPVAGGKPAQLPRVRRVDLAVERGKRTLEGSFSAMLREGIAERLERKEQVILLLNRRGYAPILECQGCGWAPTCRDCAVSMTLHAPKRHLRCHYCGFATRVPTRCPKCGESEFALLGSGTQRVEEEVAGLFPAARILRMDMDTTSSKDAHFKILNQFGSGEADILVGTQMIAKGLDFPNVTLVGIMNADTRLLMPDFRSAEHTFHLLAQVAGRAGRGNLVGEVVLQTRNPKHDVIQRACHHDYDGFAARELEERRQLNYPPFGRIITIEFKGPDEDAARESAVRYTDAIQKAGLRGVSILGPEAPFLSRLKTYYRFQTILKLAPGADPASIKAHLRRMHQQKFSVGKTRVIIDVDPVSLL